MKSQVTLFAVMALMVVFMPAAYADSFLKIDGLRGEATDPAHKGWIALESFSWGAVNTAKIFDRWGNKVPACNTGDTGDTGASTLRYLFGLRLTPGPSAEKLRQACNAGKRFTSLVADVDGTRHLLQNVAFNGCPDNGSNEYTISVSSCQTHGEAPKDIYLKIKYESNATMRLPGARPEALTLARLKFGGSQTRIIGILVGLLLPARNPAMDTLQNAARSKQRFPTLTIETGSLKYVFTDVMVSSYVPVKGVGSKPESLALNFAKIEFEYASVEGPTTGFENVTFQDFHFTH